MQGRNYFSLKINKPVLFLMAQFFLLFIRRFLKGVACKSGLRAHPNLPDLDNASVGKIETTGTLVNTRVFFAQRMSMVLQHDVLTVSVTHNFELLL